MTKATKISLSLLVLGASVWLGSNLTRMTLLYDMFDAGTIDWLAGISEERIRVTASLFANTTFYASIAYTLFVVGVVCIAAATKGMWRAQGWIPLASVLVLLYVPVEVYLQYQDYELLRILDAGSQIDIVKQHVVDRVKGAGLYSGLSLLSYVTALIVCVWQPLRMEEKS